jgi:hypothetical protein
MLPHQDHQANNAYNLPSIKALIRLYHASAASSILLVCRHQGRKLLFLPWPHPSQCNATLPSSDATVKGHLKQTRQGLRSTKPKPPKPSNQFAILAKSTESPPPAPTGEPAIDPTTPLSNQLYIAEMPFSRLYTDDTGRLPIRARSGNQYITIAYHKLSNVILCAPYANQTDAHRLAAYNSIMPVSCGRVVK